ncbi:hypothetical protein KY289_036643 [Solanum tuberosum]|nr:hypothetical protein KY284_036470 [Solanum tuberosum]KAH0636728.1 hypothetical protein KY289_036643 [Solanum tuberosum]
MERIKSQLSAIPVSWKCPDIGKYKLSVDGYCKGNPTSVREGGILRDQNGHMIMAFTSYLGECSNNYTEIQAIKIGLKWCLDNDEIKSIQAIKAEGHIQFSHVFKEGKITADLIANLAEFKKSNSFFTTAINLPMQITSTSKNEEKGGQILE